MRRIISFLLILTAFAVNARQVSHEEAQSVASEFFNSTQAGKIKKAPRRAIQVLNSVDNQSESQPYYIFNAADNAGFVIISGDTRARKVLGYSDNGSFDFDNMPPQLDSLLIEYKRQINAAGDSNTQDSSWASESTPDSNQKLLKTVNWGQGYPYNLETPKVEGVNSVTGCVATALAIVMKYHNWPSEAFGSNVYYLNSNYESFSYDGLAFDWANMRDYYNDESSENSKKAVATLMNAVGHSVEMNYDPYESGSYIPYIGHALRYHFKYDDACEYVHHSEYSNDQWIAMLRKEIDEGRPVIYQGAGIGNHAFVCDGYADEDLFHFNWGWDGIDNGYFSLSALTPGDYDFSIDYSMVKGIKPNSNWNNFSQPYVDGIYYNSMERKGHGAVITTENVIAGEPFTFACNYLTFTPGFGGKYGVAIVSANGTIKEILVEHPVSTPSDRRVINNLLFKDCIATETPVEGDFVQLVTKSANDDQWLLVKGVSNAPSRVPARNNIVKKAQVKMVKDSPVGIFDDMSGGMYEPGEHDIPVGMTVAFSCMRQDLNIAGFPEYHSMVILTHDGDTKYYYEREMDNSISESVILEEGNYEITIHSGSLSSKSVNLTEPGTLIKNITPISAGETSQLSISGPVNTSDLNYMASAFEYASVIDLSEAYMIGDGIIPDNTLPSSCFVDKRHLKCVNLSKNLQQICSMAFYNCPLTTINIPETVNIIESGAFMWNFLLTDIMVHWETPVDIPSDAFELGNIAEKCTLYVPVGTSEKYSQHPVWGRFSKIVAKEDFDLFPVDITQNGILYRLFPSSQSAVISGFDSSLPARVIIPDKINYLNKEYTVTEIGDKAFSNSKIEYLEMPSSIVAIGESSFSNCYFLREVVLSEALTIIPTGSFTYCYELEKADIPSAIEYIGWGAFDGTKSLRKVHIPAKVYLDENGAFNGLSSCTSITVDPENPYYKVEDDILYTKDGKGLILIAGAYEGKIVIPDHVTQLPWRMFYQMPNLTEIEMPHHYDAVPYQFVHECPLLKHVTLPDDAVSTNTETISLCDGLESITIGRKMQNLMGIHDNPSLTNIYLRNENVLNISAAFGDAPYGDYNFYTDQANKNVALDDCKMFYVPGGCKDRFGSLPSEKVSELWSYKIDRTLKRVLIQASGDFITIDKVLINSKDYTGGEWLFDVDDVDNLDVVVEFTLHNQQKMTTHYTPEFNSTVTNSNLLVIEEITLNQSNLSLTVGETMQLTATVIPANAVNTELVWSSSDETVASVCDGLVTAIKIGSAIITVEAADHSGPSATCIVTVNQSSGVEIISTDSCESVKIFNLQGILVYEGYYSELSLSPGTYIIVTPSHRFKQIIN